MILGAIALPALIGIAGLGTDSIQWTLWKRQLQREADSAAIAGAITNYQGGTASSAATKEIARNNLVTLTASPVVEVGPSTGPYAGNGLAVRVALQTQRALPFSSLFSSSAPVIKAEATAAAVNYGDSCVISLESTAATGITLQGSATVDLGCGMATNSQGSSAVYAGGSSSVTASPIAAVGAIPPSGNYTSGTVLLPNSMMQADPLRTLPTPSLPSCSGPLQVQPNTSVTVSNPTGTACYKGMNLKGTVYFSPGIYYIDGSSMNFGSQAVVSGDGVVFILTSSTAGTNPSSIATLNMNGGANVNLTAPTSGTYSGILFYQDRRAQSGTTNYITGNSSSRIQGAAYLAAQQVQFTGNTGMVTDCVQIIARNVTFTGNSAISNNCPTDSGNITISGWQIRLVN